MVEVPEQLIKNLVTAFDVAGNLPRGSMTHRQWLMFAGLYSAASAIVDETGN